MPHFVRWFVPALLTGLLLTPGPAQTEVVKEKSEKEKAEPAYGVRDRAGLFGEEARRIANLECAYIHQRFKKDLLVETFRSVPESAKQVDLKDAAARRKFFQQWATEQARAAKLDGVYVLISTSPHYVEALVSPRTQESGLFSKAEANELAQKIIERLRGGHTDDALFDTTAFVRQTMAAHGKSAGTSPDGKKD